MKSYWYVVEIVIGLFCCTQLAAQTRGMRSVTIKDPDSGAEMEAYRESWAILIGIDKYQNVPQLSYATADAVAIKKMLEESFGFRKENIVLLTDENATQDKMKKAFGDLTAVGHDDRVVVFFAGHGQTMDLPNGGQMGYLIPVEGRARDNSELWRTCISMQTMKELSSYIPAKHVLFLVDACYSGLAASGARAITRETKGYIKKVTAADARQILTAGSKGEPVFERAEWGHSAFTHTLLEGLGKGLADINNDGIIQASELALYVSQHVSSITDTKQSPQFRKFSDDEGDFLFVLPDIMQAVGSTPEEPVVPTSLTNYASVAITSDPAGATILIDGRALGKTTPVDMVNVVEGDHSFELRMGELGARQNAAFVKGQTYRLDLKLESAKGSVQLASTPSDAEVFVDDRPSGKTPVLLPDLSPGRHSIVMKKEGFLAYSGSVNVRPFEQEALTGRLYKPCALVVNSDPPGASVFIENKISGVTPLQISDTQPGEISLKISSPDCDDWKENVYLSVGSRKEISAKLVSKFGLLTVNASPEATVFVDGRSVGSGLLESYKVPVGNHEVELKHPSYSRSFIQRVYFEPGKEKTLEAEFGVFSAGVLYRSAILPGWGQMYDGATVKGLTFTAGIIAAVTFSVISDANYSNKSDSYNTTRQQYLNASTTADAVRLRQQLVAQFSELDDAQKTRNLVFGATGAWYGLNLLDALIFHSRGCDGKLIAEEFPIQIEPTLAGGVRGFGCAVRMSFSLRDL